MPALRARTVLLAADWVPDIHIVESTGFSEPTVRCWHTRYEECGMESLANDGLPRRAGNSYWSARSKAERHKVSLPGHTRTRSIRWPRAPFAEDHSYRRYATTTLFAA